MPFVNITASGSGVAAGVIHEGASTGNLPRPGPASGQLDPDWPVSILARSSAQAA